MKQELHFYWPFAIPFYIMHIDIWSPVISQHNNQEESNLLNDMFVLTQFIILSITTDTKAESLAKFLME